MPADFPDNPTIGQSFTLDERIWTWDGTVWESDNIREFNRIVSDAAPTSPSVGDEWFNSSTGRLYNYYDGYWIELGASVQGQDGESGLLPVVSISSDITLTANTRCFVDTTAARSLTLPASPAVGDEIVIYDASGQASTNNITLLRNGNSSAHDNDHPAEPGNESDHTNERHPLSGKQPPRHTDQERHGGCNNRSQRRFNALHGHKIQPEIECVLAYSKDDRRTPLCPGEPPALAHPQGNQHRQGAGNGKPEGECH